MKILKKETQIENSFLSASQKRFCGEADAHVHEFFEIEYILSGSGTCIIDGQPYDMAPGTLFLLTPANTHTVQNADATLINVMFKCEHGTPEPLLCVLYAPPTPGFYIQEKDRPLVEALLLELVAVHRKDQSFALSLLSCLIQKLGSVSPEQNAPKPLPYIQRALLYVVQNFRSGITLSGTAAHLGLSLTYLSELFVRQTGMNFKVYLDRVRFSHAQNLLAFTDIPVCRIYELCGFGDYANFSRRFKQHFGVTPREYRKNHQTV